MLNVVGHVSAATADALLPLLLSLLLLLLALCLHRLLQFRNLGLKIVKMGTV